MAKLYFKYGAMNSSKSAQALITKFNYEEQGMAVWLIKPAADTRYGREEITSRVGLSQKADVIEESTDILERFRDREREFFDVIIADESQFFTPAQVEQLREIVDLYHVPVICFGLRTDFQTHLFPGSTRLLELADSISEIKTICACGNKAIVNARLDDDGNVITEGAQVVLGGNDRYVSMCHSCWKKAIARRKEGK